MATRAEVLANGANGRKETLRMPRRFEAPHGALRLPAWLVRIFRPIVQASMLAMLNTRQACSLSCRITAQLMRDQHAGHVLVALQQFTKACLRSPCVSAALHEDIQNCAVMIHRPPQIVRFPIDVQEDLIEVPRIAGLSSAPTELVGILLTEFQAPLSHGFVAHDDATFRQQFLHVTVAEVEPKVEPDGMADDLDREPEARVQRRRRSWMHASSIAWI
jgi:hypothetical protein